MNKWDIYEKIRFDIYQPRNCDNLDYKNNFQKRTLHSFFEYCYWKLATIINSMGFHQTNDAKILFDHLKYLDTCDKNEFNNFYCDYLYWGVFGNIKIYWDELIKTNIKPVVCFYRKNEINIFGLCYRYNNEIYQADFNDYYQITSKFNNATKATLLPYINESNYNFYVVDNVSKGLSYGTY